MRMIGEYVIGPAAAPVALDICEVAVGIGIVSEDAHALGETAAPDPGDEPGYPWLYWGSHRLIFPTVAVDPLSPQSHGRFVFDVRGMRKITQNQALAVVVQYTDVNGAPPVAVQVSQTRVLMAQ